MIRGVSTRAYVFGFSLWQKICLGSVDARYGRVAKFLVRLEPDRSH
jgi:hypothetical protein